MQILVASGALMYDFEGRQLFVHPAAAAILIQQAATATAASSPFPFPYPIHCETTSFSPVAVLTRGHCPLVRVP